MVIDDQFLHSIFHMLMKNRLYVPIYIFYYDIQKIIYLWSASVFYKNINIFINYNVKTRSKKCFGYRRKI